MLRFIPERNRDESLRVLCLGAHGDDIEIGCGATILRLAREFPGLSATWVVFSAEDRREEECRASAGDFLAGTRSRKILVERFRDGFFPALFGSIKERFEDLKREPPPDIVFTHSRDDAHQDHRVVSGLAWNTWRDHVVLEYEVPKYDGDLGRPGFFVTLDEETARRKASLIVNHFTSQSDRPWFREDVFLSLMRLRGVESRSPGGYAEAFTSRKLVF